MRKAALFLAILSLAACGGRTANPTSAYKFGDEDLTCEELEYEFSKVERDIRAKYVGNGRATAIQMLPWVSPAPFSSGRSFSRSTTATPRKWR
jgi:hypothetical protein